MPKSTFLNLSKAKQIRLIESFKDVFLSKNPSHITVTDIVQSAKIPRGSFYQYFKDLEDIFEYVFTYIVEGYLNDHRRRIVRGKTTFFEYLEGLFILDLKFYQENNHYQVLRKFFTSPSLSGMCFSIMEEKRTAFIEEILTLLDKIELRGLEKSRYEDIYHTANHMKVVYIQKVMNNTMDVSLAHKKYLFLVDVLKKGLKEFIYA